MNVFIGTFSFGFCDSYGLWKEIKDKLLHFEAIHLRANALDTIDIARTFAVFTFISSAAF